MNTIALTTKPHATPSRSAVIASRRNADASHPLVTEIERNAWIVTLIDCMLTLSLSASTMVRKNASTRLRASVASKNRARIAESVPPVTVTSSHGNRKRKLAPRRRAPDLFDAKPERFKKFGTNRRSRTMPVLAFASL